MFELDSLENTITIARNIESHVDAIKRNILFYSKRGYAYDRKNREEGKPRMP